MGKTLAESNVHLHNAAHRIRNMARNIESSSAIEGIHLVREGKTGRFVSSKKEISPSKSTKQSQSYCRIAL